MVSLHPILKRSYWTLAALGALYALFAAGLLNPTFQRHVQYMHKVHTSYELGGLGAWLFRSVDTGEPWGFAKGQVTPFWLNTTDGESLFCWHVLPLDVYLKNEAELVQKAATDTADSFEDTVSAKLLKKDAKSKVVVSFHGNGGHIAQEWRPSLYRSVTSIPHTHLLTCSYRGFGGRSTLRNPPHIPTETGLVNDATSLTSYVLHKLNQPASRTILFGHSLGASVAVAAALYFTDPNSTLLPQNISHPSMLSSGGLSLAASSKPSSPHPFAAIVLAGPPPSTQVLLSRARLFGIIPLLSPLKPYPKMESHVFSKIQDSWSTSARLQSLITLTSPAKLNLPIHITLLHARNDQAIPFSLAEQLYDSLESLMLAEDGATSVEERRSIHGKERGVRRGAFAYRSVSGAGTEGERTVELEIARYGGHGEGLGWSGVALVVRRAWERRKGGVGLDVE